MYDMGYYFGGYGGYFYYDWTYILLIIGALISFIASAVVRSTFNKYANVRSHTNMTGAQTAQRILQYAGITDVKIAHIPGSLSDHYDPRTRTVNLSDAVYGLPVCRQCRWQLMSAGM